MLHSKVTDIGYASLTFTETCKDDYTLFELVNGDDPLITTIYNYVNVEWTCRSMLILRHIPLWN